MNVKEMHYDLKSKLNKVDSQSYRNLRIPEIDWALNNAMLLFIKRIAEPRGKREFGFEVNQRSIDDIRNIVVNNLTPLLTSVISPSSYLMDLPEDYLFYLSAYVCCSKNDCTNKSRLLIKQHDDNHEESDFDKSSFEWKEVNGRFYEEGIRLFTDGTFQIESVCEFNYIRKPLFIHNAEDYPNGTYNTLDGVSLAGTQDCELAHHTHPEIVDIAVLLITNQIESPAYKFKVDKLNFNN